MVWLSSFEYFYYVFEAQIHSNKQNSTINLKIGDKNKICPQGPHNTENRELSQKQKSKFEYAKNTSPKNHANIELPPLNKYGANEYIRNSYTRKTNSENGNSKTG